MPILKKACWNCETVRIKGMNFHSFTLLQNSKQKKNQTHFPNLPGSTPSRVWIIISSTFDCLGLNVHVQGAPQNFSLFSPIFRFEGCEGVFVCLFACYLHCQRQKAAKLFFLLISNFFEVEDIVKACRERRKKRKILPQDHPSSNIQQEDVRC